MFVSCEFVTFYHGKPPLYFGNIYFSTTEQANLKPIHWMNVLVEPNHSTRDFKTWKVFNIWMIDFPFHLWMNWLVFRFGVVFFTWTLKTIRTPPIHYSWILRQSLRLFFEKASACSVPCLTFILWGAPPSPATVTIFRILTPLFAAVTDRSNLYCTKYTWDWS